VVGAVVIVAGRATSGSLGDDDLFGTVVGLLVDNALPGAVVLFIASRLKQSAAKPDSMIGLIRQIAARGAAARAGSTTAAPAKATPQPPPDARPPAEPVRSAATTTVAARPGRKSVIER